MVKKHIKSAFPSLFLAVVFLMSCEENAPLTSAELLPKEDPDKTEEEGEEETNEPIEWCLQTSCWDEFIFTCRDSTMIANFTRNEGWTGGDATYSIPLPDDRVLWLFGDSFINQVKEDRSRTSFNLINNCLMVQTGDDFSTVHGGTGNMPKAFATPEDGSSWYWPGHGRADEDTLYLFMHAFGTGGGGMWDFFRTGVDLLKIDPYTFETFSSTRLIDGDGISYGAHTMTLEDSVYIYGVLAEGANKHLFLARSDRRFSQPWEYYSNNEWTNNADMASSIFTGVSEQFSVFHHKGKFYLLTQHPILGKQIYLYSGESPQGPWTNRKTVYCTPETSGNIFTYNAYAHTMFMDEGRLLVSYNINSFDIQDLMQSADNYRPYFISIENWED